VEKLTESPTVWKRNILEQERTLANVLASKAKEAKKEVHSLHKTIASKRYDTSRIIKIKKKFRKSASILYNYELLTPDVTKDRSNFRQLTETSTEAQKDEDKGENKTLWEHEEGEAARFSSWEMRAERRNGCSVIHIIWWINGDDGGDDNCDDDGNDTLVMLQQSCASVEIYWAITLKIPAVWTCENQGINGLRNSRDLECFEEIIATWQKDRLPNSEFWSQLLDDCTDEINGLAWGCQR